MERPISSNGLAQVQAALLNGEKLLAIKIYREDTGASLKDAKDAVDRLESEWRVTSPEKFKAPAKKKRVGCGICLLILLGGLAILALSLLSIDWSVAR